MTRSSSVGAKGRATPGSPPRSGRHRTNPFIRPVALLVKRVLRRGLGVELTRASHPWTAPRPAPTRRPMHPSRSIPATWATMRCAGSARPCSPPPSGWRPASRRLDPEELYGRAPVRADAALLACPRSTAVGNDQGQRGRSGQRAEGRGCHQRDGIVIVGGAHARAGDLGRCSIYDMAPTLLWAMGAGIPAGGDGRVLFEAFDELLAINQCARSTGLDRGRAPELRILGRGRAAAQGARLHLDRCRRDADARRRARRLLLERPRAPPRERPAAQPFGTPVDRSPRRAREHDPLLHGPCLGLVCDRCLTGRARRLRLHDAARGRRNEPRLRRRPSPGHLLRAPGE